MHSCTTFLRLFSAGIQRIRMAPGLGPFGPPTLRLLVVSVRHAPLCGLPEKRFPKAASQKGGYLTSAIIDTLSQVFLLRQKAFSQSPCKVQNTPQIFENSPRGIENSHLEIRLTPLPKVCYGQHVLIVRYWYLGRRLYQAVRFHRDDRQRSSHKTWAPHTAHGYRIGDQPGG